MKRNLQRSLSVIFCATLLFPSLGCPIASSSEAGFDEILYDFTQDLKGFCLFWYRDVATLNPRDIFVTAPSGFSSFGINTDLDGPDEFWFPVVGAGSSAFIDFQFDNILNGDDIEIRHNSSMSRFEVTDHPFAGWAIDKGFYYLQFSPDVFPQFANGSSATDISVDMVDSSTTSRTNRLMLHNTWVLPHVVFGQAGSFSAITDIVGSNANSESATVQLDFYKPTGSLQDVTINGMTGPVHTCVLGGGLTKRMEIGSTASLTTAWAMVSADRPMNFTEAFRIFSEGVGGQASPQQGSEQTLVGEAGISATGVSLFHLLNVASSEEGLGTSIAIANPTSATATMTFTLKDSNGQQVAQGTETLDAKNQIARFFQDFFTGVTLDSFSGSLTIDSDTDIAVISLESLNGLPQASLGSANRTAP